MTEDDAVTRTCIHCGSAIENHEVRSMGSIEVWRCSVCGHDGGATVSIPIDLEPPAHED